MDGQARRLAASVAVRTDPGLLESEPNLETGCGFLTQVEAAFGSPGRPLDRDTLTDKVRSLAGSRTARWPTPACSPATC